MPNASNRIDGKYFVPFQLNGKTHLVSEEMSKEQAERLLKIPGFDLFRGDPKEVAGAITKFKQEQVAKVEKGDQDKDRTISELQRTCSILSDDLGKANQLVKELQEQNAKLVEQIGEPSLEWPRKRLADYAEALGMLVNTGNSKEEIYGMIEDRINQKG